MVRVLDGLFHKLASTESPQGVLALVRLPEWTPEDLLRGTPLVVVLDGVQDPGNAGAILRTAEAFGATGAVFLKGTVSPSNPKCLRASAGSAFRLPIVTEIPAGLALYAADPRAKLSVADAGLARSLRHRHRRRGKRRAARAGRARYRRENSRPSRWNP